ncbi:MAG: hypothetical protein ACUVTH_11060 [Thermogutta sp.]
MVRARTRCRTLCRGTIADLRRQLTSRIRGRAWGEPREQVRGGPFLSPRTADVIVAELVRVVRPRRRAAEDGATALAGPIAAELVVDLIDARVAYPSASMGLQLSRGRHHHGDGRFPRRVGIAHMPGRTCRSAETDRADRREGWLRYRPGRGPWTASIPQQHSKR